MDTLQRKISSLSAQWSVLRKSPVLLSLHRAFSEEMRLGETAGKRQRRKKQPMTMKDATETCEFLIYYGQGDRSMIDALSDLLAAWKMLVDGYRVVERIVASNSAIGTQNRKIIKNELRQLREILDQQRCEQNHPAVLEAVARIPLDIPSNQWTKVLSIVPSGILHLNNLMKLLHTDGTTPRSSPPVRKPLEDHHRKHQPKKPHPGNEHRRFADRENRPSSMPASSQIPPRGQPSRNDNNDRQFMNRFAYRQGNEGQDTTNPEENARRPARPNSNNERMLEATGHASRGQQHTERSPRAWVFQGDFDTENEARGGARDMITHPPPQQGRYPRDDDVGDAKEVTGHTRGSEPIPYADDAPNPMHTFTWGRYDTHVQPNPTDTSRRDKPPSPSPSASASVVNGDVSSPTEEGVSQAQRLNMVENRLVVFDYEMEAMKKTIKVLERDLTGVQLEVDQYKKTLVKLETQSKLTNYRMQKTMRELEKLGCVMLLQPLSEGQLRDIATWLRDDLHLRLAEILDIDLVDIENDYPIATYGIREVKVQILRRWKEMEGENGTLEVLVNRMMEDHALLDAAKGIFDKISLKVSAVDRDLANANAALGLHNL